MTVPDKYRAHAAFTRRLAHEAKTPALRTAFLDLAAEWDHMADQAERREALQFGDGPDTRTAGA
jgi:hypothetical protein